jgi:hypothetical protein
MALLDKFRDELYKKDEDDLDTEMAAAAISDFTDSIFDPISAWKVLIISGTAELFAIVVIRFAAARIADFVAFDAYTILVLAVPFVIGFVIAFAAYRLFQFKFRPQRANPTVPSGVMSGFAGYDSRQSQWTLWFVAAFGGVANSFALFLLYSLS